MPACRHPLRHFIFSTYSYWIDFCKHPFLEIFDISILKYVLFICLFIYFYLFIYLFLFIELVMYLFIFLCLFIFIFYLLIYLKYF